MSEEDPHKDNPHNSSNWTPFEYAIESITAVVMIGFMLYVSRNYSRDVGEFLFSIPSMISGLFS